MNLNRRNFLGAAAVSPLTAKDIAQKIAEDAQMQASSISLYSDSIYTGYVGDDPEPPMRNLWDAIKDIGMPEWKREDLWEDAKRCRTLDPDIAAMRSVSLTAKMQMQWRRNYKHLVERAHKQRRMDQLKRSFFDENPDISEY
ncbi:MAG: hypothetical protein RLZ98_1311 [Pseudomonadota bacterium]|jgi:hypothetical protein